MIDLNDTAQYDMDELTRGLAACAASWVPELFPNGRIENGKLRLANINGDAPRKTGSCVIELTGERAGNWYDHSIEKGGGPLDALGRALGLDVHDPELLSKAAEIIARHSAHGAKPNGKERKARPEDHATEIAFILSHSVPRTGTLLETYFGSRGLLLPASEDILFNPDLTDWQQKRGRPGMVARVRYPDGTPTGGIHRTYLQADGSGKASDMAQPKMMLGPCDGGVVMLAPIGEDGVLSVGEGIESTAAGMQMFGVPGWATLSAGGMRKFGSWLIAHPEAVQRLALRHLLVFADAGPTGEGAAAELRAMAASVGISTEVHLPRGGDDFADDLAKGLRPEEPPPSTAPRTRPIIIVTGGQLAQIIDAAEAALVASDHELFQRNGLIVYPVVSHHIPIADKGKTSGLRLVRLRANHLIERFTYWADFRKRNAQGGLVPIDCPPKIANAYLERNIWGLRHLTSITTCPTLRPDGSILDTPGYDEKTGILYRPQGVTFPEIPIEPTRDEAVTALGKLRSLIREFPFVDEASRSVALSGILTTVIRRSIDRAPLHAFTAPDVGTGKSKLVDVAAMIGMGHEAPVIAFTDDDAEMQKRLGACLIAGDTIISIDNVDKDLSSSFLCQCLTQDIVKPRILGKSEQPDISPNAVYFTTGNNLRLADDLAARRTIRGALDAKCERPDLRIFETPDPIVVLRRERPQYLAAALTVLRAYVVANTPRRPGPTGSFDEWSNWVRAALIWLDQADPWATTETVRRLDPKRDALSAVITEWSRAIGIVEELTVRQLIDRVTDFVPTQGVNLNPLRREFVFPEFREALLAVAGKSGNIDGYRLGNWLAHQKGKEVNGLYVGSGVGQATWKLYKR